MVKSVPAPLANCALIFNSTFYLFYLPIFANMECFRTLSIYEPKPVKMAHGAQHFPFRCIVKCNSMTNSCNLIPFGFVLTVWIRSAIGSGCAQTKKMEMAGNEHKTKINSKNVAKSPRSFACVCLFIGFYAVAAANKLKSKINTQIIAVDACTQWMYLCFCSPLIRAHCFSHS